MDYSTQPPPHTGLVERVALPAGQEFIDEDALNRWREVSGHDFSANNTTVRRLVATIDYYRAGVERGGRALRWIYEHGLKHSTERPDFVNEALSDAMEPVRTALNLIPERDEPIAANGGRND